MWASSADVVELLNLKFGTSANKQWTTPYGVTLGNGSIGDLFYYIYHDIPGALPHTRPLTSNDCDGVFSADDVIKVLAVFEDDKDALRRKPASIRIIERKTGLTAFRKRNFFGGWHIHNKKPFCSLFNNPFGVSTGYTKTADEFEIWYEGIEDPLEYQSLESVLLIINDLGIARKCKCGAPAAKKCARCKITRYCCAECQRVDWPVHKKHCTDASVYL